MQFKIETKETFTLITPLINVLDEILSVELLDKCMELRQNGSKNIIVDLNEVHFLSENAFRKFLELHEIIYEQNSSLVFANVHKEILEELKDTARDLLVNIAPKIEEAIDIVNMEILERDLLGEE